MAQFPHYEKIPNNKNKTDTEVYVFGEGNVIQTP